MVELLDVQQQTPRQDEVEETTSNLVISTTFTPMGKIFYDFGV